MRRSIITFIALVGISLVNLTITRCSKDDADFRKRCEEAEYLVYVAYLDADYNRILTLTDSLKNLGLFSEGKADYWMGYAYDRLMQKRMAELYWKTGIAAVENSTDDEDVRVYAGIAQRLTGLKCVWGEYEDALKIAQPAVERLEKLGCDTTGEYTNLLIYEGCCLSRFGISEEKTDESLERGYRLHLDLIKKHPQAVYYRDAIVGVINICYNYLDIHNYEKALVWTERLADLIRGYETMPDARPDYADKQWARYYIYSATALQGAGRNKEAAEAYLAYQKTDFSQTAEGKNLGSQYLGVAGRWQEAADNPGQCDDQGIY